MPCVGRTTSTKRVATTAVRRHDSETGLGGRRLSALLSGQGTCVFSAKKEKGGGEQLHKGSVSSAESWMYFDCQCVAA